MNQSTAYKFGLSLVVCLAVVFLGVSPALAQTSGTGALTGTVTDPSGGVIVGASVAATSKSTGQERNTTTDSSGVYKFALLPPDIYSVKFSASGFKTSEVPSITVSVTETPVLNQKLEVGAQSEQVTVEATAETLHTENATVGTLVGSQTVNSLPLSSRNYTQIVDLSPGVVANVANATAFGNGTQDVNVNGSSADQNNYQMDGASVTNYASGGAAQSGNYSPIGIPNPDSIQEFKIQTSQYDASYGRNPGASVNVVTKGGTNNFHGDAWEFNRNNMFNGNDFFNKITEKKFGQPNKPQTFKENQFGGTFGGPIKKDKVFFFGSYQGTRQVNGVVPQGYSAGVNLPVLNDPADPADPRHLTDTSGGRTPQQNYALFLGSVYGVGGAENQGSGFGFGPKIAANGSNIGPVALAILQAPGPKGGLNKGFFVPGAPASCAAPCLSNLENPATANEDQFLVNTDFVISQKHTFSERYFHSNDPWIAQFTCFGTCMTGQPETEHYTTDEAVLKLTSVLTNNFVNEVRGSFQRNLTQNADAWNLNACDVGISPGIANGVPCSSFTPPAGTNADVLKLPAFGIAGIPSAGYYNVGAFDFGGNPYSANLNAINQFQGADQISWNFGKQTIRAGVEIERDQWNFVQPAGARGFLVIPTMGDFLYGGPGSILTTVFADREPPNGDYHLLRINSYSSFLQDDVKVAKRLTVNVGVRWEYDGLPTDNTGLFTNVWQGLASQVNTGSFFLNNPGGTLAGFVVQSNYKPALYGFQSPTGATGVFVNNNKTLTPHGSPWDVFSPRIGLAWQPLSSGKFVVRAGYGWFHDRIYGNLLGDELMGNTPYNYPYPASQIAGQSLSSPWPISFQGLPTVTCSTGPPNNCPALGWLPRNLNPIPGPAGTPASAIGATSDSQYMSVPLVQQYNLDLQYEFAHSWVASVGYVGSHGIRLYDWNHQANVDYLIAGAPNTPAGLPGEVAASSLPFNDPANPGAKWVTANLGPQRTTVSYNQQQRAPYLGFNPGAGYVITATDGDHLYNSLQAELRHQFAHGLMIDAGYTWSKLITNINSAESFTTATVAQVGNILSGGMNSGNPALRRQQYGLAAFNRPQRFTVAYSYDLPYKNRNGFAGKALGGWTISGVTTMQAGEPFSVTDPAGGTIYGYTTTGGTSRAELANPGACNALGNCLSTVPFATPGGVEQRLSCYIAIVSPRCPSITPAFSASGSEPLIGGTPSLAAGPYTAACTGANPAFLGCGTLYGNSGVGVMRGPDQVNFDMALAKTTNITEGTRLEFRAEFYNAFNHTQFNSPLSTAVNNPNFGVINSTSVPPRVIQFGAKFVF
ncbi:MAG TPA: carboxypeptidase regulatory-like domain-containing protein [Candidatus Acidoferrales bacterium]|nr:carboxypeptidase regulatory-like domain-containing protein [Candidatus Acidoferrales bacterium]